MQVMQASCAWDGVQSQEGNIFFLSLKHGLWSFLSGLVNVYKTNTAGGGWRAADGATQSQLDRSGTREERQLIMGNWLRPRAPRLLPLMRG